MFVNPEYHYRSVTTSDRVSPSLLYDDSFSPRLKRLSAHLRVNVNHMLSLKGRPLKRKAHGTTVACNARQMPPTAKDNPSGKSCLGCKLAPCGSCSEANELQHATMWAYYLQGFERLPRLTSRETGLFCARTRSPRSRNAHILGCLSLG